MWMSLGAMSTTFLIYIFFYNFMVDGNSGNGCLLRSNRVQERTYTPESDWPGFSPDASPDQLGDLMEVTFLGLIFFIYKIEEITIMSTP